MTPSATLSESALIASFGAASSISIARTSAAASRSAVPEFSIDWLPEVTPSFGVRPVSAVIMLTRASGRSSSSAAICASAVTIPCPSSTLPVNTVALPSALMRSQASSILLPERLPGSGLGCASSTSGSSVKASTMPPRDAPTPCAKLRRVRDTFISRPPHLVRRAQHRAHDPVVRSAATEIVHQGLAHVGLARTRIAVEQRLGAHDHAVDAVTALRRLFLDEGALEGVRLFDRAEPLQRGDLGIGQRADGGHAGAHRLPVDQHRAGAALG